MRMLDAVLIHDDDRTVDLGLGWIARRARGCWLDPRRGNFTPPPLRFDRFEAGCRQNGSSSATFGVSGQWGIRFGQRRTSTVDENKQTDCSADCQEFRQRAGHEDCSNQCGSRRGRRPCNGDQESGKIPTVAWITISEALLHLPQSPLKSIANGGTWDPQPSRDFLRGQILVVAQQQRRPVGIVEAQDRFDNDAPRIL
jgi:hypothetical protein